MRSLIPFLTVVEREHYRFIRFAKETILPPIITTILFIIIFGYSLGGKIEAISGYSYIFFILPGIAGMAVIMSAFANCAYSLFMARRDNSIESILVAPISATEIVSAIVLGGVTRGTLVGTLTLLTASWLTELQIASFGWMILFLAAISTCFSAFGIIVALWAEQWEALAGANNFLLTPLTYLGCLFYSIEMLPPIWQKASLFNPLFYMIDALRWAVLGSSDVSILQSGGITIAFSFAMFLFAIHLFRRGYKLIH